MDQLIRTAPLMLHEFVRAAWHVVEPTTPFIDGWHVSAICEHLEAVTRGEIRNLLINMPPRHMKSLIVSVFWPCWEWTWFPARRWLFASYSLTLSIRDSLKCRRLIQSPWYQARFGHVFRLAGDQNAKLSFENDKTGARLATSVGGVGTGAGGDRIVVDDPHNVLEAESEAMRESALTWWDETMSTRGNDPRTVARVIVMQRVHEADLSGHVLAQGGYEHLCLPAEYEGDTRQTSIGWHDPRTQPGELLCPERFGPDEIAELKLRLGSRAAAGQLQQRPSPKEGAIFKASWFAGTYRQLPAFTGVWTAWDTAMKAKEENDETACVTIGVHGGELYLLSCWHGREETPEIGQRLVAQSERLKALFGDRYKGDFVEDKVSGTTLMQYLRRQHPHAVVIPVKAENDKISRAHGVTPLCESGAVLLPHPAIYPATRQWVKDLLDNLMAFGPAAAHDDLTDAFVYALKRFTATIGKSGMKRGGGGMA